MSVGIEWKSTFVSNQQLMSFRSMGGLYDYGLMCILKSEGAPIIGTFSMQPDLKNYHWEIEPDPLKNGAMYRWYKISEYQTLEEIEKGEQ
jgi:hypothetical protein